MTQLLAFDDEALLADRLASATGWPLSLIERHGFPDGESRLRLPPALPAHTVLLRGLQQPNEKLTELMLAAAGARELGAHRLTLVKLDADGHVLNKVFRGIPQVVLGQGNLIIGFHIHEEIIIAGAVHKLHFLQLDMGAGHLLAGPEGLFHSVPAAQIFQFGPHKGRALARLHMEKLHDTVNFTVHLDGESCAQIVH